MVLNFSAKVSDMFDAKLLDDEGRCVKEYSGYVPGFMPGGGGDYVALRIDLETGQILNWKPPSRESIESFIIEES